MEFSKAKERFKPESWDTLEEGLPRIIRGMRKMALELVIQKMIPNTVVHYVDHDEVWVSSNYSLYRSKDRGVTFDKVIDLPVPFLMRLVVRNRLPARALRLGVRGLRKLKSGTVLVIADRKVFRLRDAEIEVVHSLKRGIGPLREGWCEDDNGNCYLGEYFLNNKRDARVHLLRSEDDGQSWKSICSLQNIRHIHCVQYDAFSKSIWLGTGDRDEESSISFSQDEGETWTKVGSGDQMFRAVSLLFTQDHVYWGSDAPTRQNYIYRYDRKSAEIERLVAVDGPVHYSTILGRGIKIFATTTEGRSEGKSAEWDNRAHIWASADGVCWEDLMSWEKDVCPYILGHGRVLLAHGQLDDVLFFTTQCLKKVDNMFITAKLSARVGL
jgi:hypothetical protein